ncbi:hypothetical protein AGABI1DRAFT_132137 [Agaricus bisporus var. burnettii JB137-S8]|uniref:Uncharacterized protein n=1 Tax=Agaricus bisporus var. burnettii (strain JB137-S8 / ATCC MYA-4627 / FGSC 10392) TaxID=597362 RepID=K5XM42_AGABU|nr:uncharacterized protein AGABI1DRAFT_132137 [Agaricus bisporus var. burnettii JB137-S8]EKM75600.1 hypothetical protein AGABI1DRAFT_132137 [Agaricus bisporus var. burnettii JB137-S8]
MSLNPISAWIDDRDTRVRFRGDWRIGGTPGDFNGTVSSSTRVGDSFVIPFYGQSIVVYGTIDASSGGVVTNYSIDGAPPMQMSSQRGAVDTGKQQFWASPALNLSQHELTVTMVEVNHDILEPDEGTIWFDYFTVYDPSGHERTPSPKTPLSKGLIAGAITGSIIGLVFLSLVAFFWMRRRRLRWKDETGRRHPYYAERDQDPRDHPEEKRGDLESFWILGTRSRSSKKVIQPYALDPSVPLNSVRKTIVNLSHPFPANEKRRTISTLEEVNSGLDRTENRRSLSPSPQLPKNIVPGSTIFSNDRDTNKASPSSVVHLLRAINASAPVSRHHGDDRADELEAISPNPTSVVDDLDHGGGGDTSSVNDAQTNSEVTPDLLAPTDVARATSRSAVDVIVAHSTSPATRTELREECVVRSTIQHVDSGIRLCSEDSGLPIELPPVYSPN